MDNIFDNLKNPTMLKKFDMLLGLIAEKYNKADKGVVELYESDYPLIWARGLSDFRNIIKTLHEGGSITYSISRESFAEVNLTAKGWDRLEKPLKVSYKSTQAFIAISFNQEMKRARSTIREAAEEVGFSAEDVATEIHNEKIDDRIIRMICESKFVIADFTHNSSGVYYEAGFAKGLGIEVIYTVREDHLEELHFDTRQYPHIVWKDEADLKKKLCERIGAVIV